MFEDTIEPSLNLSAEDASPTRIIHDPLTELEMMPGLTPAVKKPVIMEAGDVEADDFTGFFDCVGNLMCFETN